MRRGYPEDKGLDFIIDYEGRLRWWDDTTTEDGFDLNYIGHDSSDPFFSLMWGRPNELFLLSSRHLWHLTWMAGGFEETAALSAVWRR